MRKNRRKQRGTPLKTRISLKRAIQCSILLLGILAFICLWPLKLVRPWHYMGEVNPESEAIWYNDGPVMQQFIPVNDYLRSISFYVYNEDVSGQETAKMHFRLFDANLNKIEGTTFNLKKEEIPGMFTIPLRGEWKAGNVYYFSIESEDTELLFSRSDGVNLDILYGYHVPCSRGQYILYGLLILAVTVGLLAATELLLRKNKRTIETDFIYRLALFVLCLFIGIWTAIQIYPLKSFSQNALDIIVYETGTLLFLVVTGWLLIGTGKEPVKDKVEWKDLLKKLPSVVQILAFALTMLGCVRYLNALSVFEQSKAINITFIGFALVILSDFSKKELLNLYNLIYGIAGLVWGIYHCVVNSAEEEAFIVARGYALYMVLWGFVVLNTVKILWTERKRWKNLSLVFTIATYVLWIQFVANRFKKVWPIHLIVLFSLFAIRVLLRGGREKYLENFVKGVFVHFIGISIYAVLYRPYHSYKFNRYAGVFHTVTSASVYFSMVLVLALAWFLVRYAKVRKIKNCLFEIVMIALSGGFLLMTSTRTGFFSAALIFFLLFIVTFFTEYKGGILSAVKRIGIIGLSVITGFLICFTACRIGPAVVGTPKTYLVEEFLETIREGEPWDSYRYMTVNRFLAIWDSKFAINVNNEEVPSDDENADKRSLMEAEGLTTSSDYSSGRFDIYKRYWALLDWEGHPNVNMKDDRGKEIAHAHNVYLQTAYDFGIGTGIYFILYCIYLVVRCIVYYKHHRGDPAGIVPITVVGIFGVCGVVEWVMVPYIPTGFAIFFIMALMMPVLSEREQHEKVN